LHVFSLLLWIFSAFIRIDNYPSKMFHNFFRRWELEDGSLEFEVGRVGFF